MDTQHPLRQLRQLLLICRIEEKSAQFRSAMKMRRFILLSVGSEAVAVGVMGTRPPRRRGGCHLPRTRPGPGASPEY